MSPFTAILPGVAGAVDVTSPVKAGQTTDERGAKGSGTSAALCVLASGSTGNCSVLVFQTPAGRRACLIDLGLSPRRTRSLLAQRGLSLDEVTDVMLTHFDSDHCAAGWAAAGALPSGVTMRVHKRHLRVAERMGLLHRRTMPFVDDEAFVLADPPFSLEESPAGFPTAKARRAAHDELGVAVFRFSFGGQSLGFATDVGRMSESVAEHLAGVDVLAIESNYCPDMQLSSSRPAALKHRIMSGHGHLSNHEAVEAIQRIQPRRHVVLLHLSRQCNTPDLVSSLHEGADYALTISSHAEPTRWVRIATEVEETRA